MKNNPLFRTISILCLIILLIPSLSAQYQDTTQNTIQQEDAFKNVVRYNVSSPLIFGFNYVVLGYERVVKPYQTFSINAGVTALPNVISLEKDSFKLVKAGNDPGLHFSFDYRFYLQKENKYRAPHGIYLAPFYSFNNYKRTDTWQYDDGTGFEVFFEPVIDLHIHSFGGELGYQFLLGKRKRFAIDLILIGPSFSFYKLNVKANADATVPEDETFEAILELIKELVPGFERVFEGEEFSTSGTLNTRTIGFRYIVHLGYRF